MSDVMPNYELEKKRLAVEISQLEHNITSQEYRILQLDDEKQRLTENIVSTHTAIEELKTQLKGLNN